MGFTETPDLDRSSVSEGPNEEEQDDIPASMLREGESFAGTESDCEVWSLCAYFEHCDVIS